MDIKDLAGLEKSLAKLIETVSICVGTVGNHVFEFDAKKIERISKVESVAKKLEIIKIAEGESEVQNIMLRAGNRFALEQYDKQVNLENVIARTSEKLKGQKVSDDPVDKDWTMRFLQVAQDISKEDMQIILAKILAGEVKKPGAFSLKILDFVRNMSQKTLTIFQKIASIATGKGIVFISNKSAKNGFFDITYNELMLLQEEGLIQPSLRSALNVGSVNKDEVIEVEIKNKSYSFKSDDAQNNLELPVINMSNIGRDISPFIQENNPKRVSKYISELVECFEEHKGLTRVDSDDAVG